MSKEIKPWSKRNGPRIVVGMSREQLAQQQRDALNKSSRMIREGIAAANKKEETLEEIYGEDLVAATINYAAIHSSHNGVTTRKGEFIPEEVVRRSFAEGLVNKLAEQPQENQADWLEGLLKNLETFRR